MATLNPFLSELARKLRQERRNYWDDHTHSVRLSTFRGEHEAGLWFRTRGCRFDHAGSCTMCNYSAGPPTTASEMVAAVAEGLATLPADVTHLLVSPSGSFLDDWEVPTKARREILRLIADYPSVSFETRPETVTQDALADVQSILRGRVNIYMGLESATPWVARNCLNKSVDLDSVARAIAVSTAAGMNTTVNVLLGAPFLSPAEAFDDALRTAQAALAAGAARICLLPVHVKTSTVLEALWRQHLYAPPSLWSYVELIHALGQDVAENRIELAWYDSYDSIAVLASPTTCPPCHGHSIERLTKFAETSQLSGIAALRETACNCRSLWLKACQQQPTDRRAEARHAYGELGRALLPEWWAVHGEQVLASLSESPVPSAEGA